jgi:hypothetical protein
MNTIFSIRTAPNKINLKDLSILFNKDKDIEIIYTQPRLFLNTQVLKIKIRKDFRFLAYNYDVAKESFELDYSNYNSAQDGDIKCNNLNTLINELYKSLFEANKKRKSDIIKHINKIKENSDDDKYIQTLENIIKANQDDINNNTILSEKLLEYYSEYIV